MQSAAALGLPLAAPQILAKPVAGANDKLNLACAAIQPALAGEADMVGLEGQFHDLLKDERAPYSMCMAPPSIQSSMSQAGSGHVRISL